LVAAALINWCAVWDKENLAYLSVLGQPASWVTAFSIREVKRQRNRLLLRFTERTAGWLWTQAWSRARRFQKNFCD